MIQRLNIGQENYETTIVHAFLCSPIEKKVSQNKESDGFIYIIFTARKTID